MQSAQVIHIQFVSDDEGAVWTRHVRLELHEAPLATRVQHLEAAVVVIRDEHDAVTVGCCDAWKIHEPRLTWSLAARAALALAG